MKHPIRLIVIFIVIIVFVLLITMKVSGQNNTETDASYESISTTKIEMQDRHNLTNESMDSTLPQSKPSKIIIVEEKISEPDPAAYQEIADVITDDEIEMLVRLCFLEAGNQSFEGQRAVIEVVFNRLLSDEFPNTLNDVVYEKNQFSPAHLIPSTTPTEVQYKVIETVLTDTNTILDRGVVFFSCGQYNDYLYAKIGDHYFCYSTKSYNLMKGTEQ